MTVERSLEDIAKSLEDIAERLLLLLELLEKLTTPITIYSNTGSGPWVPREETA